MVSTEDVRKYDFAVIPIGHLYLTYMVAIVRQLVFVSGRHGVHHARMRGWLGGTLVKPKPAGKYNK